jgi:lipoprotein-anchoring transpeptidase ErfK/SrfK
MRVSPWLASVPALALTIAAAQAEPVSLPPPAPKFIARVAPAESAAPVTTAAPASTPAAATQAPAATTAPAAAAAAGEAKAKEAAAPVVARKPAAPATTLVAKIDLSNQRLEVHHGGMLQHSWPISSGRQGYETPRGTFRPQWTAKMWYSQKYDLAPMPHAVFFTGGVAVHGTQSTGLLGQPASHGCVRLAPANAAAFYALVHKHGLTRTRIEVFGTPPAPRIARRAPVQPAVRMASALPRQQAPVSAFSFGWGQSAPAPSQPRIQRAANGVVYLPPGSPYRGQPSFVLNGVTYVRVR